MVGLGWTDTQLGARASYTWRLCGKRKNLEKEKTLCGIYVPLLRAAKKGSVSNMHTRHNSMDDFYSDQTTDMGPKVDTFSGPTTSGFESQDAFCVAERHR